MNKKVQGPHEEMTYRINGAAMSVHRRLGPGHKEDVYQRALEAEFEKVGLSFEAEKSLEVYDEGRLVGLYIPDFIVEGKVIVEIKAFAMLHQKYLGQVITYLNHTGLAVGLLINFGERSLRPRRVFPSPQAESQINHQWLFVPDWLRAERNPSVSCRQVKHNTDCDTDARMGSAPDHLKVKDPGFLCCKKSGSLGI